MSKQALDDSGKKKGPVTGRTLQLNQALGGAYKMADQMIMLLLLPRLLLLI